MTNSPTWVRWRLVALLMAFSFMAHFNRVSMSAAGDERIMTQFGISETSMGWVYFAFLLAYTLFMTPGGLFIDRWGPWLALIVMGLASGVLCITTGLVGMTIWATAAAIVPALFAIRFMMGMFNAPVYPAAGRMNAYWIPTRSQAWANGLVIGAAPVGAALTYVIFGALIDRFDWPMAFVITGCVTAGIALVWMMYARERPEHHSSVNEGELRLIQGSSVLQKQSAGLGVSDAQPFVQISWLTVLRNRSVLLLTLSYVAAGYFQYLFSYWMHYYFKHILEWEKTESRVYSGFPLFANAIGMWAGGWLTDRLQMAYGQRRARRLVAAGGMLAGAAFLCLGLLGREPFWVVTCFSLAMGTMGAYESSAWTTAIELGGRRGGTSAGIVNTGGNLGGMAEPVVTPWVSQYLGWQWGIGLGGIICLFGVSLWWWIDPSERVGEKPLTPNP